MRTYSPSRLKNEKIIVALLVTICLVSALAIVIPVTTAKKYSKEPKFRKSDNPILNLPVDEVNWLPIVPPEPVGRPLDEDAEQDIEILIYDTKTKKTKKILKNFTKPDKITLKMPGSQGSLPSELITESPIGYGERVRVMPTTDHPWRTIVKLRMWFPSGPYIATGFIIDDYHVLTAGHCVYSHARGEWALDIEVIPAFDDGYMPFYHAWAMSMTVNGFWLNYGWATDDFAIITLDRNIGDLTGWMGRAYADPSNSIYTGILNTAGYPGDLDGGLNMYADSDSGTGANLWNHWYWMDTRPGQSGSPVWFDHFSGQLVLSIVAYETPPENPNYGTRLREYWFNFINGVIDGDTPPTDYANLIDEGQDWSGFSPTPVVPGVTTFSVWSDIVNIGTAESGGFQVSYYASTDTEITASDHLIGTVSMPSIQPFTWEDSDWSGTFPSYIPDGTYWIGWIIDSTYVVPEPLDDGEGNNVAYKDSYQLTVESTALPSLITYYTNPNYVGSITFNYDDYTDGQSGFYIPASYTITANAPTGYAFNNWDYDNIGYPSIGVYVPNAMANPSTATVSGDGWLKAAFKAEINFRAEPSNGGSISYDGNVYSDGQSIWELRLPPDNTNVVSITANPSDGYTFSHWETIGQIWVASATSITTDLTVNGPGDLTAVFEGAPKVLEIDYIMTTDYVERDWGKYGDTMVVLGSGATAGAVVDLFWDYVAPPSVVNTTEAKTDGTFEVWFNVPEANNGDHYLWVMDTVAVEASVWGPFTVVSTITLDVEKGPVGTVVMASGNGFTESGTIVTESNIILEAGGFAVDTIDGEDITTSDTGSFTASVVIPWAPVGDYEVNFTDGTVWSSGHFEIDGESAIEVTPGYGPPGTVLTVDGYNFTQVSGTAVELALMEQTAEATTDASGSFTATITIPPLDFGLKYPVTAEDERNCNGTDDVLVALIVLQLSEFSGPVGSAVMLMGTGFTDGGDWNATFGDIPLIEATAIASGQTYFDKQFYVPSLPSGTYTISVLDIVGAIVVGIDFTVTDQAVLSPGITQVPNGYNLTLEGTNFVEKDAQATQWYLYNSTNEWDLNLETNVTYGGVVPTTDEFGGFTGYYGIPDFLELGSYTINCTTVSNDPIGEDWEVTQHAELDIEIVVPVRVTGPWADELFFKIYLNPEVEYLALKTGDINLMDWELPAEKVADALADPNIVTDSTADLGYYLIDINCNRWPTSDVHFRRALAHLVDKARIETDILQGFGYALDSPVPVVLGGWANPDIRTYEYSATLAAAELDLGGFTDTDADGIRNDPITGENMAPVLFYIRIDDPEREQAGEWLAAELKALGVPIEGELAVERSVCADAVFNSAAGEWNVYTGGWGIGRDPDYLADFYHSMEFDPDCIGGWRGYNYPGFVNSTFDEWADILKEASTFEDVKEAAFMCQEILAEQVPGIPMYGHINFKAYSAEWTGLVNEVGQGINSWWSTYNMHPVGQDYGGRIEYGIRSDVETLNPMNASWTYTWEVLDHIYEYPYKVNPYDLSDDWGWLAESWEIENWTSPTSVPGIKVTFHFVENAIWHDGVPFTAEDMKFTYEYIQEQNIPKYISNVQFIEDLVLVDDYTLEVYQNTTSYFAFHYINIPVLPKHIWENVGANWQDYDPVAEGTLIGLGPWKFVDHVAGEYVHLVANEDYWKFPDRVRAPLPPILSNLTITPNEVELGDNVTVSVDITNIDSQSFTYIVAMQYEIHIPWNAWTELVEVELEAYESKTVSHTITPDTVGEYNVTVDGLTGSFTVARVHTWNVTLTTELAEFSAETVFGMGLNATHGFDDEYDQLVPPDPPTGVSTYLWYPENPMSPVDYRKLSTSVLPVEYPANWTLIVKPISVSGETTLSWNLSDIETIQANYVTLETPSGTVDMRSQGNYSWTAEADTVYTFKITVSPFVEWTMELKAGWNMVSIPVDPSEPIDIPGYHQLLTWDGTGYVSVSVSEIEAGCGYWLLVLEDVMLNITGRPVTGYSRVLQPGWNMIGSAASASDASEVFPGWFQLLTWGGSGYMSADSLEPCKGYWALVLEVTEINVGYDTTVP